MNQNEGLYYFTTTYFVTEPISDEKTMEKITTKLKTKKNTNDDQNEADKNHGPQISIKYLRERKYSII